MLAPFRVHLLPFIIDQRSTFNFFRWSQSMIHCAVRKSSFIRRESWVKPQRFNHHIFIHFSSIMINLLSGYLSPPTRMHTATCFQLRDMSHPLHACIMNWILSGIKTRFCRDLNRTGHYPGTFLQILCSTIELARR